jgi:hypothetical protein
MSIMSTPLGIGRSGTEGLSPAVPVSDPILLSEYEYEPLPDENWTRILELQCGGGPISCSLSLVRIDEFEQSYEAISYVWGVEKERSDIQCNGKHLPVTINLRDALLAIRHETEPRSLWADAICIDQNNKQERAQQVKIMGEIYENAKRVLIWLGKDKHENTQDCFNLIRQTNQYLGKQLELYGDKDKIPTIQPNGPVCSDAMNWDKVEKLIELPWFFRVWVLQEVGLAAAATLLCGNASMNFSELLELSLWLACRADLYAMTNSIKIGKIHSSFEDIWMSYNNSLSWRNEMPLLRLRSKTNKQQSFLDVLTAGRHFDSTDSRDKIYAFLGHPSATASNGLQLIPSVDYDKCIEDVYFEVALSLMGGPEAPFVLSCVTHETQEALENDSPSWVPCWEKGRRVDRLAYLAPEFWYRAGGDPNGFQATAFGGSDKRLILRGFVIDVVHWYSACLAWEDFGLGTASTTSRINLATVESLQEQLALRDLGSQYLDCDDAYSLTLVAGWTDGNPAEDDIAQHRNNFSAYRLAARNSRQDTAADGTDGAEGEIVPGNKGDALRFSADARQVCEGRKFFSTKTGYLGLGHNTLKEGDLCCILFGATVPFILRETEKKYNYKLVGECYIHGIMRGEAMEMFWQKKYVEEDIILV